MKRFALLLALLFALPVTGWGQTKPLAPGSYVVKACPPMVECPAPVVCAACPVVEQTPCPAATVIPQPGLLPVAGWTPGTPVDVDDVSLVAPVAQKKKLKEWQKWAIGIGGGLIIGAVLQHQWEDDGDGGSPATTPCDAHGHGNGTDCNHGD